MDIVYFNGEFIDKKEVKISPDDRGFLFADGVYEVVRWYKGSFFDMESHVTRLKRSLRELKLDWPEAENFPLFSGKLINLKQLDNSDAMVYLQVTRGASTRSHSFPFPEVTPTSYSFAWEFSPDKKLKEGIKVLLKDDIRWKRCDIKSIALLPNTISFQEASEKGLKECIFVREGIITEGSHSNIFFVIGDVLYTHPESNLILSGITRKNVLSIARESGIIIKEEGIRESMLNSVQESFITNTSSEITPVTHISSYTIGNGLPGPVTKILIEKFSNMTDALKA
jgi:D-alanine transaminase